MSTSAMPSATARRNGRRLGSRASRTLSAEPGADRGCPRRATGGLLRVDGRDRGGQEPAADGPGAGPRRQGRGRPRPREAHDGLRRRRLDLLRAAQQRERERALLAFERDELAAADPRAGEHDELVHEAQCLGNVEAIRDATREGYALLYEADRSAQELL